MHATLINRVFLRTPNYIVSVVVLGFAFALVAACSSGSGGGGPTSPDAGGTGAIGGQSGNPGDAGPDSSTGGSTTGGTAGSGGSGATDAPPDVPTTGDGSSCAGPIDLTPFFDSQTAYQGTALGPVTTLACGSGAMSVLRLDVATPGNFRLDVSGVASGPHASAKPDASVSIRTQCDDASSELRCESQVAYKNVYFGVPEAGPVYIVLAGDYFLDGYSVFVADLGTCGFSDCGSFAPQVECDESGACVAPLLCNPGFENCDGLFATGCEADLSSTQHCGSCANVCPTENTQSSSCSAGACSFTCKPGFFDCDSTQQNGCECGPNAGLHIASASCNQGACTPTCTSGYTQCGGTCVDTSADKAHCGACNASCNGVCSQSKCIGKAQAVAQVSGYDSGALAIDASDAYFVDHPAKSTARILKVPLSGGTATALVSVAGIEQITIDATDVYYTVDGIGASSVHRIPKSGGSSTQLGSVSNSLVNSISVDSGFVYVAGGSSVIRLPKAGGTAQTILGDSDGVARATVSGSTVYATTNTFSFNGGDVKSVPSTGGTVTTLFTNLSFPEPISVLGQNLLVGHINGLTRFDLGSSATAVLFNKAVKHVIAADAFVYFVHEGALSFGFDKYGGFIGRVPLSGGTVEYLGLIPENVISGGIVEGFAVDASFVYWTQDMCCSNPIGLVKVPHD